jgi:Bacteriocin-protection, YdeI or OmpD-Associated/Domain of unknown function (DUF1905)
MTPHYYFEADVSTYDFGKYAYTVVWLPAHVREQLAFPKSQRLRVNALVNDFPVDGSFQPAGEGRFYLILGRATLKKLGLAVGSALTLSFVIADQDEVSLPPALRETLEEDSDFQEAWQGMSAGTRRAFAHRIGSAKGPDTIARRVEEVRDWVMAGLNYSDVLKGARAR